MSEKIYNNITELIGNTPLLRLQSPANSASEIIGKLEYFNPGSSVKDRIGFAMIDKAEQAGVLKPGATIIEPTSGNTGIGLALTAAVKGYKIIFTMPESMSIERRKILESLGAQIVLTDAQKGMPGAIEHAELLAQNLDNVFMPQQFANEHNPQIHYETTGPEIWNDCNGNIDVFVAAVGTGGTISGVGKYLKEKNPKIQIIAVEPVDSAVISGEPMGAHMIQGIGAGFIPPILATDIIDEIIKVSSSDAIATAKELSAHEGVICGISAGANVWAARQVAKTYGATSKRIVTIICDTGERYLSTLLYYHE
jgi:cysteine synthase A